MCAVAAAQAATLYIWWWAHTHTDRVEPASPAAEGGRQPTQPGPDSLVCKSRENICIFHQTIKSATGGIRETCVSSSSFSSPFCLASSAAAAACTFLLFRIVQFSRSPDFLSLSLLFVCFRFVCSPVVVAFVVSKWVKEASTSRRQQEGERLHPGDRRFHRPIPIEQQLGYYTTRLAQHIDNWLR